MTASLSLLGIPVIGGLAGSTSDLRSLAAVLFALPCSPERTSRGYGPVSLREARSQATQSTKSPSPMLRKLRRALRPSPASPLTGSGSGPAVPGLRNRTVGAWLRTRQSSESISTTRREGSHRSI